MIVTLGNIEIKLEVTYMSLLQIGGKNEALFSSTHLEELIALLSSKKFLFRGMVDFSLYQS